MKSHLWNIFRSSVFAGVCIALAGYGFLAGKTVGMFLFVFGLATVVKYKLKLFTGTAGFVQNGQEMKELLLILAGNWAGCLIIAMIARCSPLPLQETAQTLLESRLQTGWWKAGILSIGCGILMTTAVTFARKGNEAGNWIPLVFAVPLFIHCGFPHCIADAFYYLTVPVSFWAENAGRILLLYAMLVAGNFIGCNLYRVTVNQKDGV
ncbi:MAG: formate/nitrite transporter family protein [Paludibacteraceae bacterium]|nr:formate/nitrite transporter family protein [Paludibacteraceae bacterium]